MAAARTIGIALGSAVLGLFLTGGVRPASDPAETAVEISTIPVLTNSQTIGETLTVCMYHGARPEPFRVVASSCRGGAEHCTAFVALRTEDDQILLTGFDLLNPPVEATGPTCERPVWEPVGVFGAR